MQKRVFGDWRLIVFWAFIASAAGFAGFVMGWISHEWVDTFQRKILFLNAAAAFGTVATAIVAVAVPFYQNQLRARDERIERLNREWVVAHDVHRYCFMLVSADEGLSHGRAAELPKGLQQIESKLEIAKQGTLNNGMRSLIDRIIGHAWAIEDELQKYELSKAGKSAGLAGYVRLSPRPRRDVEDLRECYEAISSWMERLVRDFKADHVDPPSFPRHQISVDANIVGRTSMTMHADTAATDPKS